MPGSYQIFFGQEPADPCFYDHLTSLEVEENADLPGAIQLVLPVSAKQGELTFVNDDNLKPFARVGVVATPADGTPECIFDGNVLTHRLHLERGATTSKLEVWGQDASWLMNLEEKVHEWVNVTDSDIATSIFAQYGMAPAPENSDDNSPPHTEDGQSLMQRATDIAFLRARARVTGKLCRVVPRAVAKGRPGPLTGYFARPNLDADPVLTLDLNCPQDWTVAALDFDWDASRPTAVAAQQLFLDSNGGSKDPKAEAVPAVVNESASNLPASGLPLLDSRSLEDFAGQPASVMLTAPSDSVGDLTLRARGLLEEANWFVRCEGESDIARLRGILRAGDIVGVQGVGSLHSGKYLVWSVRHTLTAGSHKMHFVLVRNAVGPAPGGALNGLPGGF
jgi:hypothetical protein